MPLLGQADADGCVRVYEFKLDCSKDQGIADLCNPFTCLVFAIFNVILLHMYHLVKF